MKNIHKTKFILIGLIIGLMASSFFAYADEIGQFILTKVNYPIVINNQEYSNSELPVLNYEGNTYVPLKAVGKLLDAEVKWNDEFKRVEIVDASENKDIIKSSTTSNNKNINIPILTKDNIDYVSFLDVRDYYKQYIFVYQLDNKVIEIQTKSKETLFHFSVNEFTIINGHSYFSVEYFTKTILPILK